MLAGLSAALRTDMAQADQKISSLGPIAALTQLPTFNSACPTPPPSAAQLQVSLGASTIALAKGSKLVATVAGGTSPYTASLTGDAAATPGNISYPNSFTGSTLTLTSSAALNTGGTYTLTITDANHAAAAATFTAAAAASPGPGTGHGTPAQQLAIVLNPSSTTLPSGTAGSVTVTVTKGTPPYSPSIQSPFTVGPSSTGTFTLNYPATLAPNSTYVLSVKDKNGSAGSVKFTVGSSLSVVMPPATTPKSP